MDYAKNTGTDFPIKSIPSRSRGEIPPLRSSPRARHLMYVRLPIHESIIAWIISERVRSKDKATGEELTGSLRAIINQSVILQGRRANELSTGWSPPEEQEARDRSARSYIDPFAFPSELRTSSAILADPWVAAPCPSTTSTRNTTWKIAGRSR